MDHDNDITLLALGYGYSAEALWRRLRPAGVHLIATARDPEKVDRLGEMGIEAVRFDGSAPEPVLAGAIARATHILVSAPPGEEGDPFLIHHGADIAARGAGLAWVGYLSTTGVYGDRGGDWVDETAELRPVNARSRWRAEAEADWLSLVEQGVPVHVFRLAGIYGPGRSAIDTVREGRARRIVKAGQVFSRIHVEDIAAVLAASMARPNSGAIYNVCDDEPAPPQDVIAYACALLGVEPPPEEPFETAELSPMARSFYGESKRVQNARIKTELGVTLAYPTYRDGLRATIG